ncbi:hypothetical protein [Stenotrophomonas sp. SMYL36]|uniref:hypothetical protein n=1 Tax=Stenotrophomonas sp. SMYL36 TaxID=3076045 RepID=UPI002E79FE73|nr:hypothetical protein [Stenotrophomonas sp. SMYL36]
MSMPRERQAGTEGLDTSQTAGDLEALLPDVRASGNRTLEFVLLTHIMVNHLMQAAPHYRRSLDVLYDDIEELLADGPVSAPASEVAAVRLLTDRLANAVEDLDACLAEARNIAAKLHPDQVR